MALIHNEFGGYLPLELPPETGEWFGSDNVLRLNSGKACFFAAALQRKILKVWLPNFHSPVSHLPFQKLGIEVERYNLSEDLLPIDANPGKNDLLVWTNYYGNASCNEIDAVIEKFGDITLFDNCHAFFSDPVPGSLNSYSARKFFGVSDGAYLVGENLDTFSMLETDYSADSFSHLLIQLERGTNAGYSKSLENEDRLLHRYGLMSQLTQTILSRIDYERIQSVRNENLRVLHSLLGDSNRFALNLSSRTHILYPFLTSDPTLRERLAKNGIYSPSWWKHVTELVSKSSIEYRLSKFMVLLPIDQRYGPRDMEDMAMKVQALI